MVRSRAKWLTCSSLNINAEALDSPGWAWFRMWVRLKPAFTPEQIRQPLEAAYMRSLQDNLKNFASDTPRQAIERHLQQKLTLFSAASGASRLQKDYNRPCSLLDCWLYWYC